MGFVLHIAIDYYLHSVEPQRRLSEVFYFVERARTHTPPRFFFFFSPSSFACPRSQSSSPAEENSSIHFSLFLSLFFIFYFVHGPWSHTIRVYIRTSVYAMSRSHLVGRAETFFFFNSQQRKHPLPWFSEKVRAHLVGAPFSLPLARLYCFRKRATSLYNMRRHPHFVPFRVQRVHRAEHSRST